MKTENFRNYGKCAVFERGGVKLMVTLDVGPRIIWFGTDEFNFMNEDLDRNVQKGGEFFDEHYGKGATWYLYGGHRVWKSPEDLETYTPDNFPVEADVRGNGGTFTCRVAKWLGKVAGLCSGCRDRGKRRGDGAQHRHEQERGAHPRGVGAHGGKKGRHAGAPPQ